MRGTRTFGFLAALFFFFGALSIVLAFSFVLTSKSAVHEVIAALFLLGGGVLVIGAAIVLQLRRIEKILARLHDVAVPAQPRIGE
jgi:ABC-type nickel/cobalt efflux system permease component RcnA